MMQMMSDAMAKMRAEAEIMADAMLWTLLERVLKTVCMYCRQHYSGQQGAGVLTRKR
jgi:hypothetical protein